jgi:hypothetical protein
LISINLKSTFSIMAHELEAVFSWLEAGKTADYRAGVLLLQEHSGNQGLVNNLLKKESANNRDKLVYELVKVGCQGRMEDVNEVLNHFAQAVQGATTALSEVAKQLGIAEDNAPAFTDSLDKAVAALELEPEPAGPEQVPAAVQLQVDILTQLMSKLHSQRVQLSNTLADIEEADGPRVTREIENLQNQYNALFEKRRRVVAGEQVAEQPTSAPEGEQTDAPVIDRAELVKQRGNLRSNISKAKKNAAEAKTEDKRNEYAQKAGKLEVELNMVEMQLAQPQA